MSDFSLEKQKLLVEYFLADESVFQRSRNILKSVYFDKELETVVSYILKHVEEFNSLPTLDQIRVETSSPLKLIPNIREQDQNWALTNIEKFCQQGAIVQAVQKSIDFIGKGNRDMVEELVREACLVGLQKDLGVDYFDDPRARLERIKLKNLVPTGLLAIDRKLYGGLNRGEITIFTGSSGAGKSLFLQNIALNWIMGVDYDYNGTKTHFDPLNVVYITLELSEDMCAKRFDSMVSGIDSREIFKRLDEVEYKVKKQGKKSGNLRIKYLAGDCTTNTNDIRAYLKEYEIQMNKKPDAIVIDYLDELMTNRSNVPVSDVFLKDKYVTSELRQMGIDNDALLLTASQLNRSAVDESEQNQAMIGGGLSKIQKGDNVISIFSTIGMKKRGEYQCTFLKTRSSSGMDTKVNVGFDPVSLRIFDKAEYLVDDAEDDSMDRKVKGTATDDMIKEIKRTSKKHKETDEKPKEEARVINMPENTDEEDPTEKIKRLIKFGKR